ncbi:hypothetical protein CEF21_15070 [Bacillus sp. FJAT-42376]|uniref:hypothetical protein n=1 Tax=Bacillus sp. FJAT-42376 TaxID=2014076 RepID=UPI000F4F31FE|nr:hypothetical protein [Bacillus sp. FJAT-42376]AZB43517.1 hypothetical protein CEF21_15070 [Bacillus sp. FJAT-42376]
MHPLEKHREVLITTAPDSGYFLYIYDYDTGEHIADVLRIDEMQFEEYFGLRHITVKRCLMAPAILEELGYDLEGERWLHEMCQTNKLTTKLSEGF